MTTHAYIQAEFNAKPFVRHFESAVDDLLKVRRRIQNKMDNVQDEVDATEESRNDTMKSINISFAVECSTVDKVKCGHRTETSPF